MIKRFLHTTPLFSLFMAGLGSWFFLSQTHTADKATQSKRLHNATRPLFLKGSWRLPFGAKGNYQRHEDKENVYIEMSFGGVELNDLQIEVKRGFVLLTGKTKFYGKRDRKNFRKSLKKSKIFSRKLLVPRGTNVERLNIEKKGLNKLRLTFPKYRYS